MAETHLLYDGTITLSFEPTKHQYRIDGRRIPSATAITGVIDKPALVSWAANQCAEYLREKLKPGTSLDEVEIDALADSMKRFWRSVSRKAMSIGTLVHAFAEAYAELKIRGLDAAVEFPIEASARRGCEAFLSWIEKHHVKFLYAERKVYSRKHDYCGTVDLIAEVDGILTVDDHKTSVACYPEYSLQLSLYRNAIDEEGFLGRPIEQSAVTRFDKTSGDFEFHVFPSHDADLRAAMACLDIRRWMDDGRSKNSG